VRAGQRTASRVDRVEGGQEVGHAGGELARDILAFCRDSLAPYKRIRRLEFADLPKTISGKIRRVELRQAEAGYAGQRPSGEYREEDFR